MIHTAIATCIQEHKSKSYHKPVIAKMHAVAATAWEIIDLHFYYVLCAVMRPIEMKRGR